MIKNKIPTSLTETLKDEQQDAEEQIRIIYLKYPSNGIVAEEKYYYIKK